MGNEGALFALLGGNRIAGCVAPDEGRRTHRGASLNEGLADRIQCYAGRKRDQQGGAVEFQYRSVGLCFRPV